MASVDKSPGITGAVDIGGTKIAVGLVTADGEILCQAECPAEAAAGPQSAVERIRGMLDNFIAGGSFELEAIGIGCTGPVDPLQGTVGDVALLPGWTGFALSAAIGKGLQVPVLLENDCDAAALGEAAWGCGRGAGRFLYVSISTGIGAGFIVDGQIYRGVGGAHPEMGHHSLDPSGPLCYCGARGCWESLASGTAIEDWFAANGNGPRIPARDICALARRGDPLALQAMERLATYVGMGLGNLMTLFAPDAIALGGGVMESAELFLARAREIAIERSGLVPAERIRIDKAALGTKAGLVGAARAAQLHVKFEERFACKHA